MITDRETLKWLDRLRKAERALLDRAAELNVQIERAKQAEELALKLCVMHAKQIAASGAVVPGADKKRL